MTRPVVAVTIGDPSGIGPEIVQKAVQKKALNRRARLLIIGDSFLFDPSLLPRSSRTSFLALRISRRNFHRQRFPQLLDWGHTPFAIPTGRISKRCGQMSYDYLETAVSLALRGYVDGIVTAPINKRAWAVAGIRFPGHTEMLAAHTHTRHFAMAFYAKGFYTVLLSTHLPLQRAISSLHPGLLCEKARLVTRELSALGIRKPRIAVAGINPHAGEAGLLGKEEIKIMAPAIRQCRRERIALHGPYPADTLYLRAAAGEFDAVLAPYHDQAMIAVKALSFGHATNITLGLPFVRTSVDHGTAFDIAGKGIANEGALAEAIDRCVVLIEARQKAKR
ncbi:MAG: 4-hydroxythreonine-4-phosphate dehydrogenase PdxA [Acidobacteriia bacterium]|nr:4-hydroxythreonine-4-phosphate dehydrogenase PdxA [Terriglobia bacterium]